MEWFTHAVLGWVQNVMEAARARYGVDPLVFIVISVVMALPFYYSLFRSVRAIARRRRQEVVVWSTVFLAATVAPYLYVLVFGHGLPWWVYAVIALLVGQGVYAMVRRLRKKP
jgi:hypothetical protein